MEDTTEGVSIRANSKSFATIAELLVGPKRTRFLIHTDLLTQQSPYFRAALEGPFVESATQSIALPDISVDTFQLLVSWLYTSSLTPAPFKDGKPAYYTLLHLYVLADRLCFEGLRNYVVDHMAELADRTNSVLTPSDTRILYDAIRDDAKIRELVLDLFAFKKTDKLLATHLDRWHAAFLRDLCVRLKRPCRQAMLRHRLRMWCPDDWHATRACDNCRVILPPWYGAVGCDECCCAWCIKCVEQGVGMASWEDGRGASHSPDPLEIKLEDGAVVRDAGKGARIPGADHERKWESCKPWRGSRCRIYHEHRETEVCGDVMMGR